MVGSVVASPPRAPHVVAACHVHAGRADDPRTAAERRATGHAMGYTWQVTNRGWEAELRAPGSSTLTGAALARVGTVTLSLAVIGVNLVGVAAVLALAMFVVPLPTDADTGDLRVVNAFVALGYVSLAVPAGTVLGFRGMRTVLRWLRTTEPADDEVRTAVLRAPLRIFVVQVALWAVAAAIFGLVNALLAGLVALPVAVTILLTGMTTASLAYLSVERLMRPVAARALTDGPPGRLAIPGVATRSVLAWALGTGVPVLGLLLIGVFSIADEEVTVTELSVSMVVLGGTALAVGLLATIGAARATSQPIDSVRDAMQSIERGDLERRVPVYDGTQVGQLQLGFNRMAAGLAERERIREALGTYVSADVADRIINEGTDLAGEEVEVTVLFLDIRDFTAYAERTPASDVVATVNRLFAVCVPIVHDHGGRVDSFVGDGFLAVFGAPRRLADHADRAVAAAISIRDAVAAGRGGDVAVGIGINSGTVVAGNVGGAGRLEFSVIGDVVNVAARVEAATRQTGDTILCTMATRDRLRGHAPLAEREPLPLKGKSGAVPLFAVDP